MGKRKEQKKEGVEPLLNKPLKGEAGRVGIKKEVKKENIKKKKAKKEEKDNNISEKKKGIKTWWENVCNKFHLKKVLIFTMTILIILLLVVPVGIYFYSPLGKVTRPIFEKIPYPVAFVGEKREMISTKELLYNINSVKKFYEDQDLSGKGLRVDFTTPDGKVRLKIKEKKILDKHIEDRIIEQLGNRYGIKITQKDAQKELDEIIKKAGSKRAVELKLVALYGWSIDDFRDKVVVYQMYTKKLFEKYTEISEKQREYKEMEKAREELASDGSNFVDIVKKYSEVESVKSHGELGWFSSEKLETEVKAEIADYEKGQVSGIITSRLGFHIIQLQDYREIEEIVEEDDEINELKKGDIIKRKEYKIRQIFKRGISFVKWVEREKQKTKVSVWMKEYEWDEKGAQIRFSDEKMRFLEKKIMNRSNGDPSIN